jgi:WS/DGAT/MGAT family acyltransferase
MTVNDALGVLEAGFLHLESPLTPMHVGSLSIYEGGPWRGGDGNVDIAALRSHVESRLALLPRLRQRIVWPPGHIGRAHWVDDPDFNIEHHVVLTHLAAPADDEALLAFTAQVHMGLLDRSHPLWELWFVDGLADGRVALIEKIHHALADGVGGVDVALALLDPTPGPEPSVVFAEVTTDPLPSFSQRLRTVAGDEVAEQVAVIRGLAEAAIHPLKAWESARGLISGGRTLSSDLVASPCSLNRPIGSQRHYRVVRLSLLAVRELGHELGGTINDVVLSAVTSALRTLLTERGEELDHLQALVPVSIRTERQHQELGNRVAALVVPLPVGEADPGQRFAMVSAAARSRKAGHEADLSLAMVAIPDVWPEPVLAAVSQLIHHQTTVNLVVTNVPGPAIPLYLCGARLLETAPIVPLAANLTLSIGILSYDDQLTFGLFADDNFEDLDVLASGIADGFAELQAMVEAHATPEATR